MLLLNRSLLMLFAFTLFAEASAVGTRPEDYVARAKQLIRKLHPNLDSGLQPVIIDDQPLSDDSDRMNNFIIEFTDLNPNDDEGHTECWCSKSPLSGHFLFEWQSPNKELILMTMGGPVIDSRRDSFAAKVNRHPKWSDAKVIEAMKAEGARFTPGDEQALARALAAELKELKPVVGGEIEVLSLHFNVREFTSTPRPKAFLAWVVTARWHGSNGQEAGCLLGVEPFDGQIERFQRSPTTTVGR